MSGQPKDAVFARAAEQLDPPRRLCDLTDAELDELEQLVKAAEQRGRKEDR